MTVMFFLGKGGPNDEDRDNGGGGIPLAGKGFPLRTRLLEEIATLKKEMEEVQRAAGWAATDMELWLMPEEWRPKKEEVEDEGEMTLHME